MSWVWFNNVSLKVYNSGVEKQNVFFPGIGLNMEWKDQSVMVQSVSNHLCYSDIFVFRQKINASLGCAQAMNQSEWLP